jgi:hypothetical protein
MSFKYDQSMSKEDSIELAKAMLNASFSEIEDIPDSIRLPKGIFHIEEVLAAEVLLPSETVSDVAILVRFKVGETVELAQFPGQDPSTLDPKVVPVVGSITSFRFQGVLGIQKFKKVFSPVINNINPDISVTDFVESLGSGAITNLTIQTTLRADKQKKDFAEDGITMVPVMYSELVSVMAL